MTQLNQGHKPPRLCKKYVEFNENLKEFVEELESGERTLIEYVHSVAFIVPM